MSRKWIEVSVTAQKTILVEVDENCKRDLEDEAVLIVEDKVSSFGGDIEYKITNILKTKKDVDQAKRHADEVLSL